MVMPTETESPIYLMVRADETIFWYVIERKSGAAMAENDNNNEGRNFVVLRASERDRVRQLNLPSFGGEGLDWIDFSRLVALNRRLYLIGSTIGDINEVGTVGLRYIDLDATPTPIWHIGGGVNSDRQGGAIAREDGWIFTSGDNLYRVNHPSGDSTKLPKKESLRGGVHMLGVTMSNILVYNTMLGYNTMYSIDLRSNRWEVICHRFWGVWSPGVILFDDSLLFSLGTQNPSSDTESLGFQARPGVYAFDIRARRWLSSPLEGLKNEVGHENFGPDLGLETVLPSEGSYDRGVVRGPTDEPVNPFKPWWVPLSLVKVGVENGHHKLGFVWDRMIIYDNDVKSCQIHWCKFKILTPNGGDILEAELLSSGICNLDESTYMVINCTAGLVIAPDEGNEEEKVDKRRREGVTAPDGGNEEESDSKRRRGVNAPDDSNEEEKGNERSGSCFPTNQTGETR
ncbi:hypothetical protein PRUPE_8G084700 [Prunus persica]|uniref:Uncharacterized protein n=1 Tax=Prunus persica TaxID=3760 RepID=A0A251MV32_PRUPE|nr:hypothetical protein PRUPE_8G084700 [Prunus persica]